MSKARGAPRLAKEPLFIAFRTKRAATRHLQRDEAPESIVARLVDDAEASATEYAEDLEATDRTREILAVAEVPVRELVSFDTERASTGRAGDARAPDAVEAEADAEPSDPSTATG